MATEYKPGDDVKNSGIYEVKHDPVHTQKHEVTCVYGEKFPPCNHCGEHPRFTAVRLAIHIKSDSNFKQ